LDLYQRFSVSSHCTAFSYKPVFEEELTRLIKSDKSYVVECPSNICDKLANLDPILDKVDNLSEIESLNMSHEKLFRQISEFDLETNSSGSEDFDDNDRKYHLKKNILNLHSEQIFLGMVSMQYKARVVRISTLFYMFLF
jgi:hypothetical protein